MGGTDYGYKYYSSCKASSLATVGSTDHGLQNRPVGMKVIDWCDANGIILPKLTTITGLSRFGNSVWNLWNKRKLLSLNYPHQQNPLTHIIRRQRF